MKKLFISLIIISILALVLLFGKIYQDQNNEHDDSGRINIPEEDGPNI